MVAQPAVGDDIAVTLGTIFATGFSSWQSYVPLFTSTGTAPSIGTGGTVLGWYLTRGATTDFVVKLTWGTSPAAGTGSYVLSLPVAWANNGITPVFNCDLFLPASGAHYSFNGLITTTTQFVLRKGDGTTNAWGAAYPAAPVSGNSLSISGTYVNA